MTALKSKVHNRGTPPDAFLAELIAWGKDAPYDIFAINAHADIYDKVKAELNKLGETSLQ